MPRRHNILKLYLALLLLIILLGSAMTQVPVIRLTKETLADNLGNQDGTATAGELKALDSYFANNQEAWCLGGFPSEYWQAKSMPAAAVECSLLEMNLAGPFNSEAELRKAFKEMGFRTPFVGIYRLRLLDDVIELVQYFRVSGPSVSNSQWESIEITT